MQINSVIQSCLQKIKENDGFLGQLTEGLREKLLESGCATVQVSEASGLDFQWTLTAEGKKQLRLMRSDARRNKKHQAWWKKSEDRLSRRGYKEEAPVPLTTEVLDALKAILETGDPETTKLDILARIQRSGTHAANQTLRSNGYHTVCGSLAKFKDGHWLLTDAGKRLAVAHIRKKECAQFSGSVR